MVYKFFERKYKYVNKKSILKIFFLFFVFSSFFVVENTNAVAYITPRTTGVISGNSFTPTLAYPEYMTVSGNYMYYSSNVSDALVIADISDPDNIVQVGALFDGVGGAKMKGPKGIAIYGDYAYVVTNTSPTVHGDIIEVVNISNPANPYHVTSLTPGATRMKGAYHVAISGNYLYVVSGEIHTVEIINISNPASPVHAAQITNGTGGANLNWPYAIAISGNYAYVTAWDGKALEVINISNPLSPTHTGLLLNGVGGANLNFPAGIQVKGNYAYILTMSCLMEVVDISNPAAPVHAALITDGTNGAKICGYELHLSGNYAYIASFYRNAVNIIDISNPTSPVHAGVVSDGVGGAILERPRGIYSDGSNVYTANTGSQNIEVIDVSNPISPVHKNSVEPVIYLGAPRSVTMFNERYAYVSSAYSNAVQVIDVSSSTNPVPKGSVSLSRGGAKLYNPFKVAFRGNYGYITSENTTDNATPAVAGLEIIDVSDPAYPVHVNSVLASQLSKKTRDIAISGDYAYVSACASNTVKILNLAASSTNPTVVGSIANGASGALLIEPSGIAISGNYAYVASYISDALEVINISNPAAPVHAGSLLKNVGGSLLDGAFDVAISGNYAYVTSYLSNALEVINISNPAAPVHAGSLVNGAGGAKLLNPREISISGNYAYIGSWGSNALEIVNISNPAAPTHYAYISDGQNGAKLIQAAGVSSYGDYVYATGMSNSSNAFNIIRVQDSVKPVINLVGSSTERIVIGQDYVDAGATAYDDESGNLTSNISVNNSVDKNTAGTYQVTYNVSDVANNSADTISRFVTVAIPVEYSANSNGTISGLSSQVIEYGSSTTAVTAVPNSNYHFTSWSDGSTSNPRVDTNVTSTISVSANFAIDTYGVNYSANSNGTISGSTTQTVEHGSSTAAVTATANFGYRFTSWSDGSTSNPRVDTNVTSTISVSASFEPISVPVISLIDAKHIIIYKDQTYSDPGATAHDSVDGDLENITVTSNVDTSTVGNYTVKYNVENSYDIPASEVTRTVEVKDVQTAKSTITNSVSTNIYIPSTVSAPTIDLTAIATTTVENKTLLTLPADINITKTTTIGDVIVNIPAGINLSLSTNSWNGIMNLPQINNNSVVVPTSGKKADVFSAIEIGLGDTPVTFDKAVKIVFPGGKNKLVGWSRGNDFNKITNLCLSDSKSWADTNIGTGSDCKINSGNDLVIWTKHFSTYTVYTESSLPNSSLVIVTPRALNKESKLDFAINNNDKVTNSNKLNLFLNADPKTVSGYAISLDNNFTSSSIIKYSPNISFNLPNVYGKYNLYLKYFSTSGHSSALISKSIEYLAPTNQLVEIKKEIIKNPVIKYNFNKDLKLGLINNDVKLLQQFLNSNGYLITKSGAGSKGKETNYFGPATKAALIKFQKANKITPASGLFGPMTRKVLNSK